MRSTEPPTDRAAPWMRLREGDDEGRGEKEMRPRENVGKMIEARRSSPGQKVERERERKERVSRWCAGSGHRPASDRPAASGRVTRGLGIVAHRWSISTAGPYRALQAL